MTPEVVLRLIPLVENQILQGNSIIPVHIQVLVTLRFLGDGSLQRGFSQDFQHPVNQSTASRTVDRVTKAINSLAGKFVQFPVTEEERERIQNG